MRHNPSAGSQFTRREALRTFVLSLGAASVPGLLARAANPTPSATPVPSAAPVVATSLGDKLNLISGLGGNIAVLGGPDGTLVIDSGLANVTARMQEETEKAGPVALLVNTHWHFDHTGGNETLAKGGARIVAHENCRKRMSTEQFVEPMNRTLPASSPGALPAVTITNPTTLHVNGEEIRLIPVPPAHTDTDLIIHFRNADLIHAGDLYFNGGYPFIDYSTRGRLDGYVAAIHEIAAIVGPKTRIIPGHGPLASPEDLKGYLEFLETMLERFSKLKAEGKTVDEVIAAAPSKDFDEKLGKAFMKPEQFVRITYTGLLR